MASSPPYWSGAVGLDANSRRRCQAHNDIVKDAKRAGQILVLERADSDRPALEQAFRAVGLRALRVADLPPGQPLADQLRQTLRLVRFVLVVVDDAPIPPAVMFEAGLAHGVGVPVAVLDGRDPDRRNVDDLALEILQPGPRLYARLTDSVGLTEQLGAYLELGQPQLPRVQGQAIQRPSEPSSSSYHGSDAARRTVEALTRLGATVFTDRTGGFSVPDLVARFPHLDLPMNPVLVEVKGLRAQLPRARNQLGEALARGNTHLGLLVTLEALPPRYDRVAPGRVIAQISLSLLEQTPERLIKLLSEARSLAVHSS
jgi:hypothetical protein